jgi:endonuclease/exonuclease/phosphatase family metal-dependent hydrolase
MKMPFYNDLRPKFDYEKRDYALVFPKMTVTEKVRTIENLIRLKSGLESNVQSRKADENLLVASWNIKEFGHTTQRLYEAYFYIAEIIARFDLVAIQEIKSSLKDLEIVMRILGSEWDYIVNDITEGDDGNSERSAYLFNNKRLRLSGLAGEIVLWPEITEGSMIKQLKRTPYVTGFKAGWKSFAMINLHLHPGKDEDDIAFRKEEIRLLIAALKEKKKRLWTRNLILSGDFNLYEKKDTSAVALINQAGYSEVEGLIGKDTNASQSEAYDRLFVKGNKYFQVAKDENGMGNGNVFNPFEFVFKDGDHKKYKKEMVDVYGGKKDLENDDNALEKYYTIYWRRNQISDHFPIWFELVTDSSVAFLNEKKAQLGG